MATEVKKLQFSEGTDVGAPTDLGLATSTTTISAYADDAAYVTANGTAGNGDVYLNYTTKKFRMYIGSAWRNVVPESDPNDATKLFLVDVSGNSTGVSVTLDFNATANRTITFTDESQTVANIAGTQTLNNKTLDGAKFTNGFDVPSAGNASIGASVGANNLTLGGAASTVVIPGNLNVQGTSTIINTSTLDVEDTNITVNDGGNDASAEGAGLTVERSSTNGSLVYENALASKWKAGEAGAEVELANVSSNQTLTNKRVNGSTTAAANDSTSPRIVLPANTYANLLTISGANHLAAGAIYWASDLKKAYLWDGSSLIDVGSGSGSGAGEINAVLNPSASTNLTGWTDGTSHTATRVTSGSPLDPITTTAISIAASTTASESSTSGEYYSIAAMPSSLLNKKLKVEFYFTTEASQTWNVGVYAGSTRLALSTDSSGTTALPAGVTGKFTAYFDTTSATAYTVHLTRTAGSGTATLIVTNVIVGPGIQPQGAVVGPWQTYTATIAGNGSKVVTQTLMQWRENGTNIDIQFKLDGDTTASGGGGTVFSFSLPSGKTIASGYTIGTASTYGLNASSQYDRAISLRSSSTTTIAFLKPGTNGYYAADDLNFARQMLFEGTLSIPCDQFAGAGTVNLAQNDVEYASNDGSGGTTAGSTYTTGMAYGPNGSAFVAVASTTANSVTGYKVSFNTPIAASDTLWLQISQDSGVTWSNDGGGATLLDRLMQSTSTYGMFIGNNDSSSVFVYFGNKGRLSNNATYAGDGAAWSGLTGGTSRWRVVKAKSGQAVGFGHATATQSGLVSTTTQTFSGIKNNASMPAFRAGANAAFGINSGDGTVKYIHWDDTLTGCFDQGSNFDTSNDRFTVPTGADGIYFFSVIYTLDGGAGGITAGENWTIHIYKNGSSAARCYNRFPSSSADTTFTLNATLSLVATDYIEVYIATSSGDSISTATGAAYTSFSGYKLF